MRPGDMYEWGLSLFLVPIGAVIMFGIGWLIQRSNAKGYEKAEKWRRDRELHR